MIRVLEVDTKTGAVYDPGGHLLYHSAYEIIENFPFCVVGPDRTVYRESTSNDPLKCWSLFFENYNSDTDQKGLIAEGFRVEKLPKTIA